MVKEKNLSEETPDKKAVPPYLSYSTFSTFVARLRAHGLPPSVDRSMMNSMSGSTQTHLISAFKFMGLVAADGKTPTDRLDRLVNAAEGQQQKILLELLKHSYPTLFAPSFKLETTTLRQLQDEFVKAGATGGTVEKCVAFFVAAAKDAGLTISPYLKRTRAPRTAGSRRRPTPPVVIADSGSDRVLSDPNPPPVGGWSNALLSKFPTFDPSWPDEVKTKWFDAFDKLMERGAA
jgi:hypothetical protein